MTACPFTGVRGLACISRLGRMVVPGLPHHVTHYCEMLAEQLRKFSVGLLSYAQSSPFNFDAVGSRRHEPGLKDKRIAGTPISSMSVAEGPVIYFRAGSRRSPWTSRT
jgi:hypothetical protein